MKKILVAGGMLTYMLMVNAGFAASSPDIAQYEKIESTANVRHQKNMEMKLGRLADKLGIDPEELRGSSKKTIKEMLKGRVTKRQLNHIMGHRHSRIRK